MNKFEKVSSDHHQMSVGRGVVTQVPCLGGERSTLPCDLFHGAFDVT